MITRALLIWLLLVLIASINGFIRVAWLIPTVGDYWGHVTSCITLSALIGIITWSTIAWIAPLTATDAVQIGAVWVTMTLAFEFLAGHYLFQAPWHQLLADYNLAAGRLWILVLLTTLVSPMIATRSMFSIP
jgi:hypothetical protein